MSDEVIGLLQQLIRNACVNDGTPASGQEIRSVETLADYLGVGPQVVEPAPGRASAVWRVPGTDPNAPTLMLMGHTDVVPVDLEGWSRDPFGGDLSDGFVWGRGAVDMLNLTAAMACVFKPYLRGDRPPLPGDLVYLAVADEEAAGGLGAGHLVDERWDLVACDYLLTEIAFPALEGAAGPVYPVATGEKGPYWTRLEARGTPRHGSLPYRADNAAVTLAKAISDIAQAPTPVVITPEWERLCGELGLPPEFSDPEGVDAAIETLDDPMVAAYAHAVTHLTVSPNVIEAGVKANIVADRAEAQIDIRALPGQDRRTVDAFFRKAMGETADRVEIQPVADHPANSSPIDTPLWEAVVSSLEDHTGSRHAVPVTMTATTDARFFRRRGVVAYGVGLYDDRMPFGEFLAAFHGNDERVSLESVRLTTSFLAGVLDHWARVCR
jgi:acetylornithine deacetylase/succinyl-diaminopimelate desuccinylase-like protein